MGAIIAGTGSYLPAGVITNFDIERASLDFDRERAGCSLDEWCRTRLGAIERRRVRGGEGTSEMATAAARQALEDAQLKPNELDLIVVSTITSDQPVPPSAADVQAALGTDARFIQVDAACTGFIDALMIAEGLLRVMDWHNALVIGADTMSHYLDPQKFRAQTIFGDGAGAVVLRKNGDSGYGLKAFSTGSSGQDRELVFVKAGGVRHPASAGTIERREHYMELALKVIPTYGIDRMVESTREVLERAGISADDVDWVVPHQASANIIQGCAAALDISLSRFALNFATVGNTSAASIPIVLDEYRRAERFHDGDRIVFTAVGAGMAWGAAYLVWHDYTSRAP